MLPVSKDIEGHSVLITVLFIEIIVKGNGDVGNVNFMLKLTKLLQHCVNLQREHKIVVLTGLFDKERENS